MVQLLFFGVYPLNPYESALAITGEKVYYSFWGDWTYYNTFAYADMTFAGGQCSRACNYSISPNQYNVVASGQSGLSLSVNTQNNCSWNASSNVDWVTLSASSGKGNAQITYNVVANTSTTSRTGIVNIAGQTITISQAAAPPCSYTVYPNQYNVVASGQSGLSLSVNTQSNCSWNVASNVNWVTLSTTNGKGNAQITYSVAENTSTTSRTGIVNIAGQTITISQAAAPSCSYTVSPNQYNVAASGQSGLSLSVNTQSNCSWNAASNVDWVTLSVFNGKGNAQITYSVAANGDSSSRTTTLNIAGQRVSITQAAKTVTLVSGKTVTNALPSVAKAPTGISAITLSSSSAKLTWNDKSDNETGFYIYRSEGLSASSWVKVGSVAANIVSYTDTGLNPNTTYSYYVTSYSSVSEDKSTTTSIVTPKATPSTQLRITVIGSGSSKRGSNGTDDVIAGRVVGNNIDCSTTCIYTITEPVTLSAVTDEERLTDREKFFVSPLATKYAFEMWGGECSGNGSCIITPDNTGRVINVTATYYPSVMAVKNPIYTLPAGWITQTYRGEYSLLYNAKKAPVGTTIRIYLRLNYVENPVGWVKTRWIENSTVCTWRVSYALEDCYSYDLRKASN